jgi:hypothetical protein
VTSVTTLLADLKWNDEAKVSALKAEISYEIKDRLVSVLPHSQLSPKKRSPQYLRGGTSGLRPASDPRQTKCYQVRSAVAGHNDVLCPDPAMGTLAAMNENSTRRSHTTPAPIFDDNAYTILPDERKRSQFQLY